MRLLVAGVSTRALAESAARAGHTVTALDAFGDLDQHPSVRARSLPRDAGVRFTAAAAARLARTMPCDAVAYLAPFEHAPRAVAALARGRALWGNPPDVLRAVRDPRRVAEALERRGLPAPALLMGDACAADAGGDWLLKPLASGGGRRVRRWRPGRRVPPGFYRQAFVDGTPGSVVFVAAGGRAVPLGVSRQIVGDAAFGASGYRYCGSILSGPGDGPFEATLAARAGALAQAVAAELGLVGLNGVDFIARDGHPFAIEVNPRWCASMELVERAFSDCVFEAHVAACASAALPAFDAGNRTLRGSLGKAIVFARGDVTVGDTRRWLDDDSVRDVPHPGERVLEGHPVCTVFATGSDAGACYAALVERAARAYAEL